MSGKKRHVHFNEQPVSECVEIPRTPTNSAKYTRYIENMYELEMRSETPADLAPAEGVGQVVIDLGIRR